MPITLTVHRPRGVVPKLAVRKRTVVHYQPSWLLLALPAIAVVRRLRGQRSRSTADTQQVSTTDAPAAAAPSAAPPRRRRGRLTLVAVTRLRRRGGGPGAPDAEVIVVTPVTPGP